MKDQSLSVFLTYLLTYYLPGVTKRCLLSWLTNNALIYEPECGRQGVVARSQPMCAHEAQINFGYLAPYLIYAFYLQTTGGLDALYP